MWYRAVARWQQYDYYAARLICGFRYSHCESTELKLISIIPPNFGKLNFSQFLIPEFGLGKFGTMLHVAHKTRRRTRQFIGVDFVIHQQAFASLVTVDLWSQPYAGPHVSRLT